MDASRPLALTSQHVEEWDAVLDGDEGTNGGGGGGGGGGGSSGGSIGSGTSSNSSGVAVSRGAYDGRRRRLHGDVARRQRARGFVWRRC